MNTQIAALNDEFTKMHNEQRTLQALHDKLSAIQAAHRQSHDTQSEFVQKQQEALLAEKDAKIVEMEHELNDLHFYLRTQRTIARSGCNQIFVVGKSLLLMSLMLMMMLLKQMRVMAEKAIVEVLAVAIAAVPTVVATAVGRNETKRSKEQETNIIVSNVFLHRLLHVQLIITIFIYISFWYKFCKYRIIVFSKKEKEKALL